MNRYKKPIFIIFLLLFYNIRELIIIFKKVERPLIIPLDTLGLLSLKSLHLENIYISENALYLFIIQYIILNIFSYISIFII